MLSAVAVTSVLLHQDGGSCIVGNLLQLLLRVDSVGVVDGRQ